MLQNSIPTYKYITKLIVLMFTPLPIYKNLQLEL